MIRTPLGEIFVLEFAILIIKGIRQNRIGKHIFFTNVADNIHENLLEFNQIFDVVNGESSIWELNPTK